MKKEKSFGSKKDEGGRGKYENREEEKDEGE